MTRADGVKTLSFLVVTIALYLILWQSLLPVVSLPVYYYGRLIELLSLFLFMALALFTDMDFWQMGIVVPRAVLLRSLCAGLAVSLLLIAPIALAGAWRGQCFCLELSDISRVTYILVAPLQEVLAKSVMYHSFELCLDGKSPWRVNLLCALCFALFHVVYGVRMMLLSILLCLITGWLFHKFRCVWGCAVVHFALGFFPACFGF